MKTIQASVNTRLLSKASRLFTGTLAGRIIEILQNARRAKARHVEITNDAGFVTVRDDGRRIRNYEKLLDLGGSGWEESLEASEDPAGVGLFCLAPRELIVRSRGMRMTVSAEGWTGAPVDVQDDPEGLPKRPSGIAAGVGTEICFKDEPWTSAVVDSLAAFCGLEVTVENEACPKERFIRGQSAHHPQLGCRVKVVRDSELTPWHRSASPGRACLHNVLLNFHASTVWSSFWTRFSRRILRWIDTVGNFTDHHGASAVLAAKNAAGLLVRELVTASAAFDCEWHGPALAAGLTTVAPRPRDWRATTERDYRTQLPPRERRLAG